MHGSDFYYNLDTAAVATTAAELSMVQQALWKTLQPHLGEGMPQPSFSKWFPFEGAVFSSVCHSR